MTSKAQYWAYYNVNSHSIVQEVWNQLEDEVPGHYNKEINPHITIHPRFQFTDGENNRFEHYVYECFPSTIDIKVTDFYYHPKEYQPMVICLDVDLQIDFKNRQNKLCKLINNNGGRNVIEPSPPHITIFKSKDKGKGYRKIPSNVNQIRKRCKKFSDKKLPIHISETELVVERAI